MYEPYQRFEILNNFFGFGNPKGGIWFIGLEEAGEWTFESYKKDKPNLTHEEYLNIVDNFIHKYYDNKEGYLQMNKYEVLHLRGRLYDNIHLILCNDIIKFDKIPNVFLGNLFPLSLSHHNQVIWDKIFPEYRILFNLEENDRDLEKYISRVSKIRFVIIREKFLKFEPQLIVCHGITSYYYFQQCFEFKKTEPEYYKNNSNKYFVCKEKPIIVVNQLSSAKSLDLFREKQLETINEKFNN